MSMSGALKVLHVTETLPGGIATYLRELLLLHKDDPAMAEVRVLAPQGQLSHLKELPPEMLMGYERSGRNLRSLWNLVKALKTQIAEFKPQVVHLHSSFAGAVGRLMRPWLPKDVRIVYCPHGWAFSRDDSRVARQAYIWIERHLASRADAWIAISRYERDAAAEVGIDTAHAHLIYNGVSDTRDIRTAFVPAFDSEYLNLLFVGRHDRQKGLDVLLSAMAYLQAYKIRLHVAGSNIVGSTGEHVNADNIFWLGWLSEGDLIAYYRACDAVVMPSRWEGFGLVAIEAMSEGKAVIATRCGALPEIIEEGCTGRLIEPQNPQALAQALAEMNPQQLLQWGAAGREKFVEEYTIARLSRELLMLYETLTTNY